MSKEVQFIALFMTLWGPGFSLLLLGSGTTEEALKKNLEEFRASTNIIIRSWGNLLWIFFDKLNRWIISLIGFVILFFLKIG